MIWPSPRKPKDRDIRIRRVFALWPTLIDTSRECVTVWLQHYYVREVYVEHCFGPGWYHRDKATERGWLKDKTP
jgi:hypothetical protein